MIDWHFLLTLNMKAFFFIWFLLMLLAVSLQSNQHVKYTTVTIQKVINLSNHESQRLEITAEIDSTDEDELQDCLTELNATISDALTKFKSQHNYVKKEVEQVKSSTQELPW